MKKNAQLTANENRSPIDLIDRDRSQAFNHQDQSTSDRFLKFPRRPKTILCSLRSLLFKLTFRPFEQTHSVYKKTHCNRFASPFHLPLITFHLPSSFLATQFPMPLNARTHNTVRFGDNFMKKPFRSFYAAAG